MSLCPLHCERVRYELTESIHLHIAVVAAETRGQVLPDEGLEVLHCQCELFLRGAQVAVDAELLVEPGQLDSCRGFVLLQVFFYLTIPIKLIKRN